MFAKAAITGTLQAGGPTFTAEYLVVAGGGGGGSSVHNSHAGGGAGAGGYRSSVTGESSGGGASAESALSIALGTPYTVTVGSGGSSVTSGNSSTFGSVVSTGGGHGGTLGNQAENGGSGGGAFTNPSTNTVGLGTSGQGFAGGSNTTSAAYRSGGGGGAGAVGTNGADQATAGNGGTGVASLITGASIYRAGGGGGGASNSALAGDGGLGGGGDGAETGAGAGSAGAVNTGGGGGGGGESSSGAGGAGGSGVVIIRVPSEVVAEFSAGVVYNYIPLDDFNVYEITAAGVSDTVTFSQGALATIDDSLRFNDNDSAYLSRAYLASATNTKATFAFWYKGADLSASQMLYQARDNSATNVLRTYIYLESNVLKIRLLDGAGAQVGALNTTRLFRDPSAWYHIVLQLNTTQSTAADRIKLYINGIKESDFSFTTYPALNFAFRTVSSVYTEIGRNGGVASLYLDGYLADYYFIDGEALDPSRFGKQDADGIWQPISYTGTYGTNGFHLDFADNSTAAALGTDTSGNGNDWTPSGITTDDQVTDTPSVNYATWNPLDTGNLLADGNLQIPAFGTGGWKFTRGTFAIPSGKWYWEASNAGANIQVGISERTTSLTTYFGQGAASFGYYNADGYLYRDNFYYAFGDTWGSGDVIGIAFDADTRELTFYKNNVSQGSYTVPEAEYFPAAAAFNSSVTHNFGQKPFAYTPPTGFVALNSSNLPAPTITDGKEHFDTVVYTGNGTSQSVRGLEFQPDLVWIKNRDTAYSHWWQDAVRGAQKQLNSDNTNAENSYGNVLASFLPNGFSVNSSVGVNASGQNHVAWNWNAGGSTVTNTDGTITSQVRANTDAGISIVSYTGTGSAATVGHGLNQAPDMIIVKNRDSSYLWAVYHSSNTSAPETDVLILNSTAATADNSTVWNDTAPTSSVFSVETSFATNLLNDDFIAYCFAGVDGFSKFGSYTGNGSADGPFVYTGFRPAFVMFKRTDTTGNWAMLDSYRNAYNIVDERLFADLSDAASTLFGVCDFTSNGFKFRTNAGSTNASGGTYIYMAFAENPFKTARAR